MEKIIKLNHLLDNLKEKQVFKSFIEKYPESSLSAGFFIFDFENNKFQHQLDFFVPSLKKLCAFEFPFETYKIMQDELLDSKLLSEKIVLDTNELLNRCNELIKEKNIKFEIKKIIAVLKKDIWNLTCLNNSLGILRIKINSLNSNILEFEKGSLMDFMKVKKFDK